MLGLFAFFYGCLHFLTYIWLDQFFDWHSVTKDVVKRPFITVGFTAFVLMIPLALTSTQRSIRWLGKKWQALHRLIYVTAILGVIHYIWLVKKDIRKPVIYACSSRSSPAAIASSFGPLAAILRMPHVEQSLPRVNHRLEVAAAD